jgi:hypothetical protein
VPHDDVFNDLRTREIAAVASWVALDRVNIVNRHAGIYYVVGPSAYETGEGPRQDRLVFYWNPDNLEKCMINLGRSATGLWKVLHHPQISKKTDVMTSPWPAGLQALRELLRWYRDIDPSLRGFLDDLDAES